MRDLSDNIAKDNALLKEYEDALRLEDEPRRRKRYSQEVQLIKESAKKYRLEYEELAALSKAENVTTINTISRQLHQMDSKLNLVLDGQVLIYQELDDIRQNLLEHYNLTERAIVGRFTQQLNKTQLLLTQTLLTAFERNQPSELDIDQILALLEQNTTLSKQTEIRKVINNPKLDAKHKLKLSIPILPLILDYEGEFEIGNSINIQTTWEWVKTKLRLG